MIWREIPVRALFRRRNETGKPELPLLSVYRDFGVVPRTGREDNFNRPGDDLTTYQVVLPGDLVLNKMKTWQGSLGISNYEGLVSPAYFVAEPRSAENPRFLHYLLRSLPLIAQYAARSKGIRPAQWDLSWEAFSSIRIALPSKWHQAAIATFLTAETARIDTLVAKKRQMIDLLAKKRSARISQSLWLDTPYDAVRLRHLAGRPTSGNRDHGAFVFANAGVPCLRGLNIKPARIDRQNLLYIDEATNQIHSNTILRSDDVVIVRSGFAGSAVLVPRDLDGCNCVDLVLVRKSDTLVPRYVEYVVNSERAQEQVRKKSSGALLSHFNAVDAGDLIIPYRELAQQEKIVAELDQKCSKIDQAIDLVQDQIMLLKERRQALITAAVTGEMDVPGVSGR